MPKVGEAHPDRRLGVTGVARGHRIGDLGDPRTGVADEDLQQDLEADRVEPAHIDRAAPEHEQATHRVAHRRQPARKQDLGEPCRHGRGHRPARTVQAVHRARTRIPGADNHVHVVPHRRRGHLGRRFRWMLQVRVHHQDPVSPGRTNAEQYRTGQAPPALSGLAVQEPYRHRTDPGERLHDRRRVIGAVVDDDYLCDQRRHRAAEPFQQRLDVARLVAGRNNDGEPRGIACHEVDRSRPEAFR